MRSFWLIACLNLAEVQRLRVDYYQRITYTSHNENGNCPMTAVSVHTQLNDKTLFILIIIAHRNKL